MSTILNSINTQATAFAVMLPCSLTLGPGGTVTGVKYATGANAAACAGAFSVSYAASYAAAPVHPTPNVTVPLPPGAVTVTTCGAAVARSGGRLPPGTCTAIGAQLAATNNITAPINDDTALYVVLPAAVLPTYVGLLNMQVKVSLGGAVPPAYRNFGLLASAAPARPFSIAGRNRPADLRPVYEAPLRLLGTARGLLGGVSLYPPEAYNYSPL